MANGSTPVYSAFAVVALESIWPSADGDEVPINYLDLSYLEKRLGGADFSEYSKNQSEIVGVKTTAENDLVNSSTALKDFFDEFTSTNNITFYKFDFPTVSETDEENEQGEVQTVYNFNSSVVSGETGKQIFSNINSALSRNQEIQRLVTVDDYFKEKSSFFKIGENGVGQEEYLSMLNSQIEYMKIFSTDSRFEDIAKYVEIIDAADRSLLDKTSYGTYPQSVRRPEFSSILSSEDAYKKRRGYFKIIPLNVVQASTSSSMGGQVGRSEFSVSFTLDDVLLVADEYGSQMLTSTIPKALPIDVDSFMNQFSGEVFEELAPDNMSVFRVSGDDFTFNIEDLIEANDTATVWFYHDPKEFDFVGESSEGSALTDFILNKDFSAVIGNGSRKSQDDFKLLNDDNTLKSNPPRTLVQSILTDSEVLNPYTNPESLAEEDIGVDIDNLDSFEFLIRAGKSAGLDDFSIVSNIGNEIDRNDPVLNFSISNVSSLITPQSRRNNSFVGSQGSVNADNPLFRLKITRFLKNIYFPDLSLLNRNANLSSSGNRAIENSLKVEPSRNNFRKISSSMISSMREVLLNNPEIENSEELKDTWFRGNYFVDGLNFTRLSYIYSAGQIEDLFQTIIDYKDSLEKLAKDSLNFIKEQNQTTIIDAGSPSVTGYVNRRSLLKTSSHGETPYLALKGHISTVQSQYGASQGSNLVTVSGSGYEKILTENIVYYEDLFSPTGGAAYINATEAYPIYSQMLPPKAMLSFIEVNAPRFIIIGKPSLRVLDAKNMSLYFARVSKDLSVREEGEEIDEGFSENESESQNVLEDYFSEDQVLVRGVAAIDINTSSSVLLGEDRLATGQITEEEQDDISLRIFYPVNYLNTSRIKEMIKALETAYEANIEEAVIKVPIEISSKQTIANNLSVFNGPQEINHLFVDETGRFRQRLAFEGWERTPQPEYTPTITDNELLASGSSFSRDSSQVKTLVDIRANYQGTATGIVDARFAGRTLSEGNDYIPVLALSAISGTETNPNDPLTSITPSKNSRIFSNFYSAFSEPFFRYGMRYELVNDLYTTSTRVAKRKSIMYQGFFSKPIKSASISIKGDTSYRVGETVLVSLQKSKSRSREIIDVNKTFDWLNYINKNSGDSTLGVLRDVYIGVDKRWLNPEYYYLSSGSANEERFPWISEFREDPHGFVLDKFIETFFYIKTVIGENNPLIYITPEYFPTTRWAFSYSGYSGKFGNANNKNILDFYDSIYENILGATNSENISSVLSRNPEIINAIRMQNFRSTSYHIDKVSHSYTHGESFVTNLSLNHGQDNLVLLEPFTMRPIGFMSIEKRMRIGYDDVVINSNGNPVYGEDNPNKNTRDRLLWEDYEEERLSDLQVMYLEQFNQDSAFKTNSFLYNAQRYRNTANFYYDLDLELS